MPVLLTHLSARAAGSMGRQWHQQKHGHRRAAPLFPLNLSVSNDNPPVQLLPMDANVHPFQEQITGYRRLSEISTLGVKQRSIPAECTIHTLHFQVKSITAVL
jgi:hypothetical protein